MTSISSLTSSQANSPLQGLQDELSSEVQSGAISSSDESALSASLTDIDSQLKSQAQGSSGGSRPSPGDVQSKINDLIQSQVDSGKLTSAQGSELSNLFASSLQGGPGGPGGAGSRGGGGHAGGAGGPPPSDGSSSNTDTSDSISDASSVIDERGEGLVEG